MTTTQTIVDCFVSNSNAACSNIDQLQGPLPTDLTDEQAEEIKDICEAAIPKFENLLEAVCEQLGGSPQAQSKPTRKVTKVSGTPNPQPEPTEGAIDPTEPLSEENMYYDDSQ
jgi:hypothetical protein